MLYATGEKDDTAVAKNHLWKKKTKKLSTQKPKKSKRELAEYPALDPSLNLKTRTELLDYDYLHKLNAEELKWLNKFTEEYVNASINTVNPRKNLHKSKALKKDCYDRNNARNRDVLTRQKAFNKTFYLDDIAKKGYDDRERLNSRIELKMMGVMDEKGRIKRKRKSSS